MEALKSGSDVLFILLGGIMVLAMHSGFAFLELDGLRAELDRHDNLARRIRLPPGLYPLLPDHRLLLAVHFGHPLDRPDVGRVLEQELLLLQLIDEFGPPDMDRITGRLGHCGEGEGLEDGHLGSPLIGQTQPILTRRTHL